eukprot:CAMPEP_0196755272 /NCGR_PEP_ID=MMETSP1091-20130531/96826_1 /TAXON_ID=302021 /ORGANISM="Rhodomonas sp., Strain CCMP768" /LENGTH=45 /DNA_ID= /DNA_START= /DNA_END= /DNA_ORIENTATION=
MSFARNCILWDVRLLLSRQPAVAGGKPTAEKSKGIAQEELEERKE